MLVFEVLMNEYIILLQLNLCIESMLFVKRIRFLKIEFDVFLMRFWLFLKLLKELVIVFFFMIVFNEVFKELDKYGFFYF